MTALLSSVFVASVLGSLHCVGMCGPFATLATARRDRVRLPQLSAVGSSTAYNGGRLITYLLLGAAAGGVGSFVDASGALLGLTRLATGLAGGTMVVVGLIGLAAAAGLPIPSRGARGSGRVFSRISGAVLGLRPRPRAIALGALTSLMPCGWLWAFVLTAAGVGTPLGGATVMAVFWAGTVPAMALLGAGVHLLSTRLRRHLPWLMPAMVVAVGTWTLVIRLPVVVSTGPETTSAQLDGPVHEEVPDPKQAPCH